MFQGNRLLLIATVVSLFFAAGPTEVAAKDAKNPSDQKTYTLQSTRAADTVDRIGAVIEVGGELKSKASDGKIERSKMSVNAKVVYDERTLEMPENGSGKLRSIRHYDRAEAKLNLPEKKIEPKLRSERCLIGTQIEDAKVTMFSPHGQLTCDELELIDLLANSLLLDRFLPGEAVGQGDVWEQSDELIIATLGLDRVSKNTVKSTLSEINEKQAVIEMEGRVEGAINGVTTRVDIKGKYRFDRKTDRIDWFGLLVREDRDIGHEQKGFNVVARLRMQILPGEETDILSDDQLEGLALEPNDELTQLVFEPDQGGWRFRHDRRWYLTHTDPKLTLLRLIDEGDFIAQCNVAHLAPVEPGKQATLEQFQEDIKKALGDEFGEFVSANQKANDQNYRVLNVVVRGTASELPIEWHYYLVADEQGHQVAFTFTVEGPLAERLGKLDDQLVKSLRFTEPKVASNGKPKS